MPYARSLHQYTLPEFFAEPPESWETRLREVSPVQSNLAHLRFRLFDKHRETWANPERPQWTLYSCTPKHLIHAGRAAQYERHWSELPRGQQAGRYAVVSNYQHYMWHVHGVEAKPFLILQGDWGGTVMSYTDRERRYLDGAGALSEPFPLGFFPATPFGEHVVKTIQLRDRLLQACNRYDDLEKMDLPETRKAEEDAAERVFRETYLDTWYAMIQPQAEFMKSYLRKSEADMTLAPAPDGLNDSIAVWKEKFVETGDTPSKMPTQRALQVPVKQSLVA